MNTLYLIRGLPGSGKTTLTESLGKYYFEADQYFMKDGEYKFDASKLGIAHKECFDNAEHFMKKSHSIVVSNTFTTEKELKPYLELGKKYGYKVVSLIVENRHGGKSVHDVPETVIEKMRDRFSIKL